MARDVAAAVFATIYLVIYILLMQFNREEALILYLLSPLVIALMAYVILKDGYYRGRLLDDNEFGYADKNNEDLWIL